MSYPTSVDAISAALPVTTWKCNFAKIHSVVCDSLCHELRSNDSIYIKTTLTDSYRCKSP
jgi:hypothetical protein